MRRVLKPIATFVAIVVFGGGALGGSLALLVPAGRELAFGTTSYGLMTPELSPLAQRSLVFDRNGNLISVLFAEEDREPMKLDDIPQHLIDAVLAIEDRTFYEHHGVDWRAAFRALVENLESGEIEEGGSTITQQLVKNTMFEDPEQTLARKIREAVLANRLEDRYTKDEILERYLNVVYLGNGAYGIRAAAERYYRKDPSELTVGESALLAGIIKNPVGYDPIRFPSRAARRRTLVLRAMTELDMVTPAQVAEAKREPLPTTATTPLPRPDNFFVEEVKKRLLRDERLGATYQERYQKVFRGGLRIYTTLDPRLQLLAENAIDTVLPPSEFAASLVAVDNTNGAVRAIVGGKNFKEDQYNLATLDGRQTGSAFKGITLAAALEAGYSPDDKVNSSCPPGGFNVPGYDNWDPGGAQRGVVTLRTATAASLNCAYARVVYSLGPEKVAEMGRRLGITKSTLEPVPSITLGSNNTTVLEMATAFSVFAAEGVRHDPVFVSKVEGPDGSIVLEETGVGVQAIDPEIARTETDLLRGVVTGGTGTRARIDRPVAGKTGTTNDYADAWFVGYTPQMTAAVWMGHPRTTAIKMRNVGGVNVTGGSYPARIWAAFMKPAHEGLPVLEFTSPDEELWPTPQSITELGRVLRGLGTGETTTSTGETTTTTRPRRTTTTADDDEPEPTTTTAPAATTTPPAVTTSPPTTSPPTTSPPTTPPTTEPPTTEPPTTEPPTTSPPTSGGGP